MRRAAGPRHLLLLLVAWPALSLASSFPTRQGESGLLDVPDAQLTERRTGTVGLELGFDHAPGRPDHFGPMPLSIGVGLGRFEWAVSARESGFPGDTRPAPMLFGTAVKVGLFEATGRRPGVAFDAYLDRFNLNGAGGGRLILSTGAAGPLRLTGFAGYERQAHGASGLTAGLAGSARHSSGLEVVLEALTTPRGELAAAAVRYDLNERLGVGLVTSYLPGDKEFRIALAFGFHALPSRRAPTGSPLPPLPSTEPRPPEPEPSLALEDRPHFRLKIRAADPARLGEPRHTQYAPYTPPPLAGALAAPPRLTAPSAEDVLAAQLRDQELQLEARLKLLGATEEGLTRDEGNLETDGQRLDDRERALAAREAPLDVRERRLAARGAPTEPQRQLESQEAQLGASERQLAAQERSFTPTREAALGTEGDARNREQGERAVADRLLAQADAEKSRTRQGELRRQSLAARERMTGAMETRLKARGERVDAAGRQQRARTERVETWQRRLDVRAQRLDLLEQRAASPQAGAGLTGPGLPLPGLPLAGLPLPGALASKAAFVMVVHTPTATMKRGGERSGPALPQSPPPTTGGLADRAVAAATMITFATPAATLSELDRETLEGIARLASKEGCEVMVWARAKDPSQMTEAIRRADQLKVLVVGLGGLQPGQVVTRSTVRPGALGVDVVVSALRAGGKPRADAVAEAAPAGQLTDGETARRQLRDAVVAVQPAIERCVTEQMTRRGLSRADGVLKLTVSPAGRVTGVGVGSGELGGGDLEACLKVSAGAWQFPSAEGEYQVDVPLTVVGAGAKP
jgi:hypothetical protein